MTLALDRTSLLVSVAGTAPLAAVERELAAEGLSLRVAGLGPTASSMLDTTVADWLARGAPGAPSVFSDPADHVVAGLTATLLDGRRLEVLPSPRRAVGPDLIALFVGTGSRFGTVEQVWLRVHPVDAHTVDAGLPPGVALDPPVSPAEEALALAIARELGRKPT
jgi:alkyldihydroxyacetonephosphate synthase